MSILNSTPKEKRALNVQNLRALFERCAAMRTKPHTLDPSVQVDATQFARGRARALYVEMIVGLGIQPGELDADALLVQLGLATSTNGRVEYADPSTLQVSSVG